MGARSAADSSRPIHMTTETPLQADDASRGSAWRARALWLLAAVLALPLTWSTELADLGGDSATYVLTARHFAPYLAPDGIAAAFAADSQFPPGYPLLLALTGGAADLRLAHAATAACLLAALAATHALLRALQVPRALALATTALFALLPGTLPPLLTLKSEPLYAALSLGGLALLVRATAGGRPAMLYPATALLAAALLTRSAGWALLPALLIASIRVRPRGWPWLPVAMVAPALAWSRLFPGAGYGEMFRVLGSREPLAIAASLLDNAGVAAWGVAANVLQAPALWVALLPLAALAIAVAARRLVHLAPDAWYLAAYVGMLVVWPFPEEAQRFAWVVVPVCLGYAVLGAAQIAARLPGVARRATAWSAPALLAVLVAPSCAVAIQRAASAAEPGVARLPEYYEARAGAGFHAQIHLGIVDALREIAPSMPADGCTYAISASVVSLHTGRMARSMPVAHLGTAPFEAAGGCSHVLLLPLTNRLYPEALYPLDLLGARLEVVAARAARPDVAGSPFVALARLRER